jgi:hypothetical protein
MYYPWSRFKLFEDASSSMHRSVDGITGTISLKWLSGFWFKMNATIQ